MCIDILPPKLLEFNVNNITLGEYFNMKKILIAAAAAACIVLVSVTAAFADSMPRPSVLTTGQGIEDAIMRTETDETVAGWYDTVLKNANSYLKAELITDKMDSSADMMYEARKLKERVLALSFVYFKTGDKTYSERACDEVLTACTFNWGDAKTSPLGMAEMAFGVALGYDWLYDEFTADERLVIEDVLMEKAIKPYYDQVSNDIWWGTVESNWNIVCNGGVLTAIMALNEKSGDIGAEAFSIGLENISSMMPLFGPDGAWEEGLMYWRFTTEYFTNFMSTLINFAGTDCGFCEWEGVDKIGYYPYLMSGAGGGFSYSDCIIRRENPPQVFWFADYFGDDGLNSLRLENMQKYKQSAEVRDILWYNGKTGTPALKPDNSFDRVEAFSMRDTYENDEGIFLAGKGGQIGISHSHLDAGSFVLDAMGKRFVTDLGMEEYNNPAEDRYQLYRNSAQGHNTLVINPSQMYDQERDVVSELIDFESGENAAYAVLDLTPSYKDAVEMKRGFFFDRTRKSILVQDEIILGKKSEIYWFVHTAADITIEHGGKSALLEISGKSLRADIIGDNDYTFEVMEAKPLDTSLPLSGQSENTGIKKLTIHIKDVHDALIKVNFTPMDGERGIFEENVPIEEWGLSEGLFITDFKDTVKPGESYDFTAKLISAEDVSEPAIAMWSLDKAYDGVSIDSRTGLLTVSENAEEGSFLVKVINGARTAEKTISIKPIELRLDSMPLSVLPPSEGTTLTLLPQYTICYENGKKVENEALYSLSWRLGNTIDGVSIDENGGAVTVESCTNAEYAEIIAALDGMDVLSKKLYFTTKSLSSSEMGAIAWNYSAFGGKPWLVIDGDRETYIDTGVHSSGADSRIWIKLADTPVLYNKVRVTIGHTENTKAYMLTVSDEAVGTAPSESTVYKSDAPILYPNYSPGGQFVFLSDGAPEDTSIIIRLADMASEYMSFENKAMGGDEVPNFLLNEIEVFNSSAGNAEMAVNAENPELIKCDIALYDTEGDAIEAAGGVWSIEGSPKGIKIDQNGEITVMPWAEKKDITVCYTYTSDASVIECRKTVTAGFVEARLFDGEDEAVKLAGGRSYTAEFSGEGMYAAALYRIVDGTITLYSVQLSGGEITVPDDGAEYEIKLMCLDKDTLAPLCDFKSYSV